MRNLILKYSHFFLISFVIIFTSCTDNLDSQSENNVFEFSSTERISNLENNSKSDNYYDIEVSYFISSDIDLSLYNDSEEELQRAISNNEANILYELYIDGVKELTMKVVGGDDYGIIEAHGCGSCPRDTNGNIIDSRECSQEGVKICAWSVIESWSTVQAIIQSFSNGVITTIELCLLRNCFGY